MSSYSCYEVTKATQVLFVGLCKIGNLLFLFISVSTEIEVSDSMSSLSADDANSALAHGLFLYCRKDQIALGFP